MANSHANDAMIRRLEKELEERSAAAQAIIGNAEAAERDLNDAEKETLAGIKERVGAIAPQIAELENMAEIAGQVTHRLKQLDNAVMTARRTGMVEIEYRSAGAYLLDYIEASSGSQAARERLEVFNRVAAHQKTSDNLGIIPDPIVGDVVNFIDAARPMVSWLGPRNMPSQTWYRPKVTQNALVAKQGAAGAAADEKAELTSQKMTITRLTGTAVTYGGYVNVSRQNIDFSSPDAMDIVIQSSHRNTRLRPRRRPVCSSTHRRTPLSSRRLRRVRTPARRNSSPVCGLRSPPSTPGRRGRAGSPCSCHPRASVCGVARLLR